MRPRSVPALALALHTHTHTHTRTNPCPLDYTQRTPTPLPTANQLPPLQPFLTSRFLTTEASSPAQTLDTSYAQAHLASTQTQPILEDTFSQPPPPSSPTAASTITTSVNQPPPNPFLKTASCTLHAFPSLEPVRFTTYPDTHLLLPLRRDILHRAVVFEGDATRQGTASTQWRSEVHGSNRKIRPQKGTGRARLGNKKSPMLKGGGVAFGPKPRDFSTDLPRKVYDLAWRTALSYRYRKGELLVIDGAAEIDREGPGSARWIKELLRWHALGNPDGRSLFVTAEKRPHLFGALDMPKMGKEARALEVEDVDVKDLLEHGRLVIEQKALNWIFREHSTDLKSKVDFVV